MNYAGFTEDVNFWLIVSTLLERLPPFYYLFHTIAVNCPLLLASSYFILHCSVFKVPASGHLGQIKVLNHSR